MTTLKGRELDACIAERVFDPHKRRIVAYFSTNITAAFQVVEKMREGEFVVELENTLDGKWKCTFYNLADIGKPVSATTFCSLANTLPEAICLAALEATQSK